MPRPDRIEGLAIVSAEGMIADAQGIQPPSLKLEADQKFFQAECARADVLVHGRHSSEGGPHFLERRRLILTRQVPALAPDPDNPMALLWNPAGASLDQAWDELGFSGGLLTVIGGTEGFGLFLELGYDAFYLTRAAHARLPGGRPVFPGIPARTPEELLTAHGLKPEPVRVLDASEGVTLATWTR
jgi:dihydrofolate reductase